MTTTTTVLPDLRSYAADLARELSAATGDAWELVAPAVLAAGEDAAEHWHHFHADLRRSDGATIHLNRHSDKGKFRVAVRGSYCRDRANQEVQSFYRVTRPEITVSAHRPACQAAAEVARRFLPEYLPLWDEGVRLLAQRYEYEDAARALAERLHAAAGKAGTLALRPPVRLRPHESGQTPHIDVYGLDGGATVLGDIDVYCDSVSVSLTLTPRLAEKLMGLLADLDDRGF